MFLPQNLKRILMLLNRAIKNESILGYWASLGAVYGFNGGFFALTFETRTVRDVRDKPPKTNLTEKLN